MNNYKIIIFTNKEYLDKSQLMIQNFKKLNISSYNFVCLDNHTFKNLFTHNKELHLLFFKNTWNDKKKLWVKRMQIMNQILSEESFDILHCDADAEWLKNPMNLFDDENIDMYFANGLNYPDKIFEKWGFVVRGGFYYLRNNAKTQIFINKWVEYTKKFLDDQVALNFLLNDLGVEWDVPKDKYYIRNYKHSNDNTYDILHTKDNISGKLNDLKIEVLSPFKFPRLSIDNNSPYVVDLYNQFKYAISR